MSGDSSSFFASSKFSLRTQAMYSGAKRIVGSISGSGIRDPERSFIYNRRMRPFLFSLLCAVSVAAQSAPNDRRAREIFKELIEINTTDSIGNVTQAAEAVAAR